jgi:flagellar hook-associated protein 2
MTTSSTSNPLTSLLSTLGNATPTGSSSNTGPLITTGQINVGQLVSELMTVQSQPLTQLQNQEAGVKSTLSAYGQEQSALSTLLTATQALSLPSAFQAAAATVTGTGTSAIVTGTPANGSYSVAVTNLAQAQSIASAPVASASTTLGTGTLSIQLGTASGSTFTPQSGSSAINVTIDSTNNTLSGIASAINSAANGAVNASVVTDANGQSQLVLRSANTGSANAFTVTASSALSQFAFDPTVTGTQPMTQTQAAADANFSVNGLALTSASNAVTTAISGVTLNLTQAPASGGAALQSQVTIATNPTTVTNSVNSFVSAYNALITLTNSLTSYNATSNSSSVLTGDSPTRNMLNMLQSIIGSQTTATGAGTSDSWLAQVGMSMNSDGTLSLNSTQFQSALSANPTAVTAMFTSATGTGAQQGFAVQISNAAQQIISPNGSLGAAQQSLQSQITYMNNQQAAMQAQLSQTQAALTKEYSALNAEVTAAQAQQASLASQLAALPG